MGLSPSTPAMSSSAQPWLTLPSWTALALNGIAVTLEKPGSFIVDYNIQGCPGCVHELSQGSGQAIELDLQPWLDPVTGKIYHIKFFPPETDEIKAMVIIRPDDTEDKVSLLEETIEPRKDLPPLLVHVRDRRPEQLHYLGVSFGLTRDLFHFWRRHKFAPFYIGQVQSSVTGEHTCMVLKPLSNDDIELGDSDKWGFFHPFYQDFRQRFARLLGSSFCAMDYKLAMSILDPKTSFVEMESHDKFLKSLDELLTPYDMKRLESYTNNLADFHLILDLVPVLSDLYFQEKLPVRISYTQASVLLCMGLQYQNVSYIERAQAARKRARAAKKRAEAAEKKIAVMDNRLCNVEQLLLQNIEIEEPSYEDSDYDPDSQEAEEEEEAQMASVTESVSGSEPELETKDEPEFEVGSGSEFESPFDGESSDEE